jgi:hypothetical protein
VEDVAPVHERGVGDKTLGRQPRQGELRAFREERAEPAQTGGADRIPSGVVEEVLVRIDDDMLRPLGSLQDKGFSYGQGRAAVSQSDLHHDTSVVSDEKVAQDVTVLIG